MHEDLNEYIDDFSSLEYDERRQRINDVFQTVDYTPDTPRNLSLNTTLYNPGLQAYKRFLSWGDNGWEPVDKTDILQFYPAYLPTDEAIQYLCSESPLLEIGAGAGYWTHVVNQNGGECLATDISPRGLEGHEYPIVTRDEYDENNSYTEIEWSNVKETDHTCVESYPDRTVLLCHPPGATQFTVELLTLLQDSQRLVFVGEWYPGADATPKFFKQLIDNWRLCADFPVYDWASMHAHGYVFEREQ